jgi:hypothetical protein
MLHYRCDRYFCYISYDPFSRYSQYTKTESYTVSICQYYLQNGSIRFQQTVHSPTFGILNSRFLQRGSIRFNITKKDRSVFNTKHENDKELTKRNKIALLCVVAIVQYRTSYEYTTVGIWLYATFTLYLMPSHAESHSKVQGANRECSDVA